jgi:hypothetical protein
MLLHFEREAEREDREKEEQGFGEKKQKRW